MESQWSRSAVFVTLDHFPFTAVACRSLTFALGLGKFPETSAAASMSDCICAKRRPNALPISGGPLSSREQWTISSATGLALPNMLQAAHLENAIAHEFPSRKTPKPLRASRTPVFRSCSPKTSDIQMPSWARWGLILPLRKSGSFRDLAESDVLADFSSILPCCKCKPCSLLQSQGRSCPISRSVFECVRPPRRARRMAFLPSHARPVQSRRGVV
jgi:hypothetical protein